MNKNSSSARAMQLMAEAGVDSVRDDAYWSTAEPRRGLLRIDPAWQSYLSKAREHKLRPLLVLGYGSPFYDNYAKPRLPSVKDGFGNYVNFLTRELADSVDFYEIWNEWDRENPVDPAFSQDYSNLIKETSERLRNRKTPVTILAGAVTTQGMDLGFADRLIESGVLNHVDGLSLHPYVHCRQEERHTPERWIAWLRWVDADLRTIVARPVPLYLTEMGWPSNDGDDRTDPKQNFGLLQPDLGLKPAYLTLKAISPTLHEYRYDAEKSREEGMVYLLRFAKGSEQVLVAWTAGHPRSIQVDAASVQRGNVMYIDSGDQIGRASCRERV